MRALIIQHDHTSPTGAVGRRLAHHGFAITEFLVVPQDSFDQPNVAVVFPRIDDFDLIVALGAPWGAWDDACIGNWLTPEIELIRQAVTADKPVLGICFGGQLVARAMGGSVARGVHPEIGWTSILSDEPDIVGSGPWFEFHYDNWQVPPGAREIARNPVASQAFVIKKTLALQFHPELEAASLSGWLAMGGRTKVMEDGQDPDVMLAQTVAEDPAAEGRTYALVDAFLSRVAGLR
ncbi:MAG: type 1 glutamine amidotransferase [Actinomycetales bacterium]|nr:type 1 glutamine amidotransferase [Actinomycetales bacterium]